MTNVSPVGSSILERIGNTSMMELRSIVPENCARIMLKVESENPTGCMKDRMAVAMLEAAEQDGRLTPGGHVVEYTAGSTGVSLALVCAVKGYKLSIVTSDAFSAEKRNHMAALGANLTIVPSVGGGMDETLTRNMIDAAKQISANSGGMLVNQLGNADQLPAYHKLGEEIWTQTRGKVDAFVQSSGSAASVRGVSEILHQHNTKVHCVAVEPSESPVLSGGAAGVHKIEGIGAGFVVPLWKSEAVDEIAMASTAESMDMSRRLAKTEGLFAGTSTGANLVAAIKIGRRLGPRAIVVTLMCDSGVKYLSTGLFRDVAKGAKVWQGSIA